jgi:hypothetical protein
MAGKSKKDVDINLISEYLEKNFIESDKAKLLNISLINLQRVIDS